MKVPGIFQNSQKDFSLNKVVKCMVEDGHFKCGKEI
jgi:hypothetical protein